MHAHPACTPGSILPVPSLYVASTDSYLQVLARVHPFDFRHASGLDACPIQSEKYTWLLCSFDLSVITYIQSEE